MWDFSSCAPYSSLSFQQKHLGHRALINLQKYVLPNSIKDNDWVSQLNNVLVAKDYLPNINTKSEIISFTHQYCTAKQDPKKNKKRFKDKITGIRIQLRTSTWHGRKMNKNPHVWDLGLLSPQLLTACSVICTYATTYNIQTEIQKQKSLAFSKVWAQCGLLLSSTLNFTLLYWSLSYLTKFIAARLWISQKPIIIPFCLNLRVRARKESGNIRLCLSACPSTEWREFQTWLRLSFHLNITRQIILGRLLNWALDGLIWFLIIICPFLGEKFRDRIRLLLRFQLYLHKMISSANLILPLFSSLEFYGNRWKQCYTHSWYICYSD